MAKQIGIDGKIKCPNCDFEGFIKNYCVSYLMGEYFKYRCLTCGKEFTLRWAKHNVIFLMEEKDD